jgi:hypothetical protein
LIRRWTQLEEKIGKTQIELGKDIINENVQKEKKLSERDKKVDPSYASHRHWVEQPWVWEKLQQQ